MIPAGWPIPWPSTPPPPLSGVPWRPSTKALVLDPVGRLLLLRMQDPLALADGAWWELPGGGIEPGESAGQAVLREVAEETGYRLDPGRVGPVTWTRRVTFRWLGVRRWQQESVHLVRTREVDTPGAANLTPEEASSLLEVRWWSLVDLADHLQMARERTYPGRLLALAPMVLAGQCVDEPFEWWN